MSDADAGKLGLFEGGDVGYFFGPLIFLVQPPNAIFHLVACLHNLIVKLLRVKLFPSGDDSCLTLAARLKSGLHFLGQSQGGF